MIMTEALAFTVLNPWCDVIQKVFAQLPSFFLGGKHTTVTYNYDKEVGGNKFCQIIGQKHAFHNETGAIIMYHFLPET